jgi:hypothetical protein
VTLQGGLALVGMIEARGTEIWKEFVASIGRHFIVSLERLAAPLSEPQEELDDSQPSGP